MDACALPLEKTSITARVFDRMVVRTHLAATLVKLTFKPATLRLAKRRHALRLFAGYIRNGQFPLNLNNIGVRPVFIDELNTLCAVGFLVYHTGNEKFALDIRDRQNYINLDTDKWPPRLLAWAADNGFTRKEVATIQPTYGGVFPAPTDQGATYLLQYAAVAFMLLPVYVLLLIGYIVLGKKLVVSGRSDTAYRIGLWAMILAPVFSVAFFVMYSLHMQALGY